MKKLFFISALILLLSAAPLYATSVAFPGPGLGLPSPTPAGTTFTECFGEGRVLSWLEDGGTYSFYHTWKKIGTVTIENSLDTGNGAGPKSVEVNKISGEASYIYTPLNTTIAAGTPFTSYVPVRPIEAAINSYNSSQIYAVSSDITGTNAAFRVSLYYDTMSGGRYGLFATGQTSSAKLFLSTLAAQKLVKVVINGSSSFIATNGETSCPSDTATCASFTARNYASNYVVVGTSSTNTYTYRAQIGRFQIDCPTVPISPAPPTMFVDFETGSGGTGNFDGDVLSVATLNAMTRGGNGSWTISPDPITAMKIDINAQMGLHTPITVGGSSYDGSGTRGLRFDSSIGNQQAAYGFIAPPSKKASCAFRARIPATSSSAYYYPIFHFNSLSGQDAAGAMIHDNEAYLETHNNPNDPPNPATGEEGAKFAFTPGAEYEFHLQHDAYTGYHQFAIFETSTYTQVAYMKKQGNGTTAATVLRFGPHSDWIGGPHFYVDEDSIRCDLEQGTFPLPR